MIHRARQELARLLQVLKSQGLRVLLYELFRKPEPASLVKLFRYFFVAVLAYFVDFGLLVLMVSGFGVYYLIAATISFTFGVTVNYFLSREWVFPTSRHSRHKEMAGVLLIGVVGLVLNNILLVMFTDWLGMFYVYSKLLATVIVFFWNFFARHVFLRPSAQEQ